MANDEAAAQAEQLLPYVVQFHVISPACMWLPVGFARSPAEPAATFTFEFVRVCAGNLDMSVAFTATPPLCVSIWPNSCFVANDMVVLQRFGDVHDSPDSDTGCSLALVTESSSGSSGITTLLR